eukprot:9476659-Pyramimonas_sp.AAC.1
MDFKRADQDQCAQGRTLCQAACVGNQGRATDACRAAQPPRSVGEGRGLDRQLTAPCWTG